MTWGQMNQRAKGLTVTCGFCSLKEWGLAAMYTQECSALIILVSVFTGIEAEPTASSRET